jgi:tetratricopeptide (TPR) repeat protein
LIRKIHLNNIIGTEQRPFYWRSRVSQANSALALGLEGEAIRLYRESIDLVPTSWALRNRLAETYIDIGQPWEALVVLEESIAINRDYYTSNIAECWEGIALKKLELIREPAKMQDPNLATKC